MAARPIRLLGDPILRARCERVEDAQSPAVRLVADDLQDTLRRLQREQGRGRGLAAPQIGAPIRVVYIEIDEPWWLVNPEIIDIGNEDFQVWDDCFSAPGLLVRVERAYRVKVKYEDLDGEEHVVEADGNVAELLQHEIDHLDGVLLVDRPVGLDPFCYRGEWEKRHRRHGRVTRPTPRAAVLV
jgi:peptide deformylase